MPEKRTGLLIIRAWIEGESPKPLRAHIRATTDVSKGFESELTVADLASTAAIVESWLGDVLAAGQAQSADYQRSRGPAPRLPL